jgi:hypothetical protein
LKIEAGGLALGLSPGLETLPTSVSIEVEIRLPERSVVSLSLRKVGYAAI